MLNVIFLEASDGKAEFLSSDSKSVSSQRSVSNSSSTRETMPDVLPEPNLPRDSGIRINSSYILSNYAANEKSSLADVSLSSDPSRNNLSLKAKSVTYENNQYYDENDFILIDQEISKEELLNIQLKEANESKELTLKQILELQNELTIKNLQIQLSESKQADIIKELQSELAKEKDNVKNLNQTIEECLKEVQMLKCKEKTQQQELLKIATLITKLYEYKSVNLDSLNQDIVQNFINNPSEHHDEFIFYINTNYNYFSIVKLWKIYIIS